MPSLRAILPSATSRESRPRACQDGVEENSHIRLLPSNETGNDAAYLRIAVDAPQEEGLTIPAMLDHHVHHSIEAASSRESRSSQRAWAEQIRNGELRIETRITKILAVHVASITQTIAQTRQPR